MQCVPSASLRRAPSTCTCAHIGLSVRPALPVGKFSHTEHCWSDTWQLTLHLDQEPAHTAGWCNRPPWTRFTPPEGSCSGVGTLSLPHSEPVFPVDLGPRTLFLSYTCLASLNGTVRCRVPATSETISRLSWANTFLEPDAGFVTHPCQIWCLELSSAAVLG